MDRADPVHIVLWKQRIYSGNSRSARSINSPPANASPSPTAVGAETNSIFLQGNFPMAYFDMFTGFSWKY